MARGRRRAGSLRRAVAATRTRRTVTPRRSRGRRAWPPMITADPDTGRLVT